MNRVLWNRAGMLAALGALLGVVGCGGGGSSGGSGRALELVDGAKKEESTPTTESERLQKMQMLQYTQVDATGKPIGQPLTQTVADFSWVVYNHCSFAMHAAFGPIMMAPPIDVWDLTQHTDHIYTLGTWGTIQNIAAQVCIGAKFVEMAEASAVPVDFKFSSGWPGTVTTQYYRVAPQSDAVRVALLKEAREKYLSGVTSAIDLLEGGKITQFSYILGCGQYGCSSISYPVDIMNADVTTAERGILADALASTLTLGIAGYEKSTMAAAEKTVAVADSQRGSTTSPSLSASRVMGGNELSRAAAAHMLLGGSPGLWSKNGKIDSYCLDDAMTPGTRRALAALRESGVPMDTLKGIGTDLAEIIDGLGGCTGSVRDRLAAKRKDARLLGSMSVEQVVGATLEDFTRARNYLVQEYDALGTYNPYTYAIAGGPYGALPLTCLNGYGTHPYVNYDYFTAQPPTRSDAWFAAYTRMGLTYSSPYTLTDLNNQNPQLGLAQFYEIIGNRLAQIVSPLGGYSDAVHQMVADSMQQLSLTLQHLQEVEIGRISWSVNSLGVNFRIDTRNPLGTDPLLLVQGEAAAECYVHGSINGESINGLAQSACPPVVANLNYYTTSQVGFNYRYLANRINPSNLQTYEPLYIIGPAANGAGKAIIASTKPKEPQDLAIGTVIITAVVPSLDEKVGQILRPSKNSCARPAAFECGGKDMFGGRMPVELPLENELSADNNGLESSWSYYLDRAATAAQEADQLGEAYLQSALELEKDKETDEAAAVTKRSEADRELDVVQEVCGIAVDGEQIVNLLFPNGVGAQLSNVIDNKQCTAATETTDCGSSGRKCVSGRCTCSSNAQCPADHNQCVAGQCVTGEFTLVASSETATSWKNRLYECLGQDTVNAWVSAGSSPLCYWETFDTTNPASRRTACKGMQDNNGTTVAHCPLYMALHQGNSPCDAEVLKANLSVGDRANTTTRIVDSGLGLFNVGDAINDLASRMQATLFCDNSAIGGCVHWDDMYPTDAEQISVIMAKFNEWLSNPRSCQPINFDNYYKEGDSMPSSVARDTFLTSVQTSLDCNYTTLIAGLGSRVFANVPDRIVNFLKSNAAVVGAYPAVGGSYGEKLSLMRAALNRYALHGDLIKEEFSQMRTDYETMTTTIKKLGLQHEISDISGQITGVQKVQKNISISILDLQKDAAIIDGTTKMIQAAASFDWMNPQSALGAAAGVVGAQLMMDNQLQQLDQQKQIAEADKQILDLQQTSDEYKAEIVLIGYAQDLVAARTALRGRSMNIKKYINEMRTGYEEFDAAMVAMESERLRALRALSRAAQVVTTQYTQEKVVDRTLSNITRLRQDRYEASRKGAVAWAVMAKRAIEQRLGVHLADLQEPMAMLDSAPSTWENDICVSSGIDIKKLQAASDTDAVNSGQYIGDYVDKLRRLVESYRMEHGFSDGTDQLVMSVKEDIDRTTTVCRAPSRNLIRSSGQISGDATLNLLNAPWVGVTCGNPAGSVGYFSASNEAKDAQAFFLCKVVLGGLGLANVRQDVVLQPGQYFLSWYGLAGAANYGFKLRTSDGTLITPVSPASSALSDKGFPRYYSQYSITTAGTYQVYADGVGDGTENFITTVGAPSLELITTANLSVGTPQVNLPLPFELTLADGTHTARNCADTDGSVFRAKHWERHCVPVCDDGVGTGCLLSIGAPRCYWQTSFDLAQRDVEMGIILPHGGFALGNFNYRIEELAVNFVGTSLRSCDAANGQECFAQGFIPYSLVQTGPFTVINHAGDAFESQLFDGRIEHAKGLATERYLTNPLSSADEGLIAPYLRKEFMGRPFDGSYALRVWEEPGVNFNLIQDVQILLKYRYWTRLN